MTVPLPSNADVIVVGAGAAGLSAAKALIAAGLRVLVLEADDHIGGRCVTDAAALSVPFDRGGSWLHAAPINPLARIAEARGESLHKTEWRWRWVQSGERALSGAELAAYNRYQAEIWTAVNGAVVGPKDLRIKDVLPPSPHRETARHWVAQMLGADADLTSAADVRQYADADGDWLIEGGFGAFVARLHADVPVRLNCPVSRIDYSGPGVRAATPDGVVTAERLVLTVSTGVLAAESIAFDPPLPDEKHAAIGGLPLGLLNKVGLDFDQGWAVAHQGDIADYANVEGAFCTIVFGLCDTSQAVGFLAGRYADQVEREGAGAATDFCLGALKSIFGADIVKYVRATCETAWRRQPHCLGSYSYASPGAAKMRAVLAAPVAERLYFAGEATSSDAYSTVHGAYQSGLAAAKAILDDAR